MKPLTSLFIVGCAALFLAGCKSAPSRFYTLNATAISTDAAAASFAVVVGPVNVPAEVNRPQFTVQVAPNRVAVDEFNRWAAPLTENIAEVVAADLSTLLGTPRVAAGTLVNFVPDYRVSLDIQKFETVPGKSVQIEALWVIRKSTGGVTLSGRTIAGEAATGDYAALAAAHSRALAQISGAIAAAIRAGATAKP